MKYSPTSIEIFSVRDSSLARARQFAEPLLANRAGDGYAQRPDYRPETKFERRGVRLGHGVWDLVFTRRESATATD